MHPLGHLARAYALHRLSQGSGHPRRHARPVDPASRAWSTGSVLELLERGRRETRVRASDAERDAVVQALKGHYAEGRLSADELTARVEQADGAESRSDLDRLTADLPAAPVPTAPARPRTGRHVPLPGPLLATFAFGALALFLLAEVVPAELWAPLFVLVVPLLVMALFAVLPLALPLLIVWLLVRGPAVNPQRRLERV